MNVAVGPVLGGARDRSRYRRAAASRARCRARCGASRAHTREQLSGAERLRHVVVGARIERRDLLRLERARRQHDDRHRRPRAHAADHVEAVAVGETEIDDQQVRLVRAGLDLGAPCVLGFDDAIVLASSSTRSTSRMPARPRRRGLGASPASRPGSAVGSVNSKRAPPPGRARAAIVPPCASTIARQIASPSPAPTIVPSDAAVELVEQPRGIAGGQARAVVVDGDAHAPSTSPPIRDARAGRRVLGRVVEQVPNTCTMSVASTNTGGKSSGSANSTGCSRERSRSAGAPRRRDPRLLPSRAAARPRRSRSA